MIYKNGHFRPGTYNCRKEHWDRSMAPRVSVPCGQCQSCKDQAHFNEISDNHKTGIFCKESNNCHTCKIIKRTIRILKHFGGTCNNSRRCEICKGLEKEQFFKKELNNFTMALCLMMMATRHPIAGINTGTNAGVLLYMKAQSKVHYDFEMSKRNW